MRGSRLSSFERWTAVCVGSVAALTLVVAGMLTPDTRGFGTHEQLGLAPCRMLTYLHVPCPFCGMTTAFALVVRGQVAAAFEAQPAGALVALAAMLTVPAALLMGATGWRPAFVDRIQSSRWSKFGGAGIVLLGWVYTIWRHVGTPVS